MRHVAMPDVPCCRTLQCRQFLGAADVRGVQIVLAVVASPVEGTPGVQADGRDDGTVLARLALDRQLLDDLWVNRPVQMKEK